MNVAEILKFVTLGYLLFVGIWFATAQPHFDRDSKARPLLFLMVGLSFVATIGTIAVTIMSDVPYVRMAITVAMTTFAALLIKLAFRAIKKKNLGLAFSGIVPEAVVQYGPYRFVRHPLYLAYSVFWTSCAILSASLFVVIPVVAIIALYFHAARSEERDLLNSTVGPDYRAYRARTGIMLPRLFR